MLAVGLRPGVDIYAGAACEFVLCFLLSFTGLLSEDAPSRRAPAGRALVCRGCRSRQGELARGSLPPPPAAGFCGSGYPCWRWCWLCARARATRGRASTQ